MRCRPTVSRRNRRRLATGNESRPHLHFGVDIGRVPLGGCGLLRQGLFDGEEIGKGRTAVLCLPRLAPIGHPGMMRWKRQRHRTE